MKSKWVRWCGQKKVNALLGSFFEGELVKWIFCRDAKMMIASVKIVQQLHDEICNTREKMLDFFAILILLCILCHISQIMSSVHILYVAVTATGTWTVHDLWRVTFNTIWINLSFFELYFAYYFADNAETEVSALLYCPSVEINNLSLCIIYFRLQKLDDCFIPYSMDELMLTISSFRNVSNLFLFTKKEAVQKIFFFFKKDTSVKLF